jgi:hypothetical protein
MWGTTSTGNELTANFGDALEDTSIGDRRLFRLFARNQPQGILGLLQHYPPKSGNEADQLIKRSKLVTKRVSGIR